RPLFEPSHGGHHRRGRSGGAALPFGSGLRHRHAQCLDTVRRRWRIRLRRRDRHRHRQVPRPRPGRARAALLVQVLGAWPRTDPPLSSAPQLDADVTGLPLATDGMRIGLFGGSFNPAHEGHRLVALQCLRRLRLDRVWLLVSPGNPLKDNDALPSLADRVRATRELMRHPDIEVTGFEAEHGFRYTYDTIRYLTESRRGTRFVWIMGADNLVQFDQWERWRDIANCIPIAVYARPGSTRR